MAVSPYFAVFFIVARRFSLHKVKIYGILVKKEGFP